MSVLKRLFLIPLLVVSYFPLFSQTPTVGLIQHDSGSLDDGYILFAPLASTETYLIDKCGHQVHSWTSAYRPGLAVYLLPDGNLLRTANTNNSYFNGSGGGGKIEKIDWNSNVIWSFSVSDSLRCQHHDIEPLSNGNILLIAWELKTPQEATDAGRNPALIGTNLWSEALFEIQPVGTDSAIIVWEWHVWDHLVQEFDAAKDNYDVVANRPELANLNFKASTEQDWLHFNSVNYNASLDQILISNHNFNEIWIIDHSTTSSEAASHSGGNSGKGGDILWRWGNALAYKHGTINDKKLFQQHSAFWIADSLPHGNDIIIFNNGNLRQPTEYSSVDIIAAQNDQNGNYPGTLPYSPTSAYWSYTDIVPENFYAKNVSGAQQLPNGNVLICDGFYGVFFEIDSNKNTVWKYINPVASYIYSQGSTTLIQTNAFRCTYYPASYSGFSGHALVAGLPIELNPYPDSCSLFTANTETIQTIGFSIFPNPAENSVSIEGYGFERPFEIELFDISGRKLMPTTHSQEFSIADLQPGLYFVRVSDDKKDCIKRLIKK
ncbi:MAG: hypothetical protein CVU11_01115 [Bacteroidetes bacterium HGW-Bacteroidetes-6]|jgi:hypothetical protein|nr:MAG: hypothetical protein CVU11_01115 [Bacteroidetes bacterium HGW-Bacteroidetes-6]